MPITAERMIRLIDAADSAVSAAYKLTEDFNAVARAQRAPGGQLEVISEAISRLPADVTRNPDFQTIIVKFNEIRQILLDVGSNALNGIPPHCLAVVAEERVRINMGRHRSNKNAQLRHRMRRQIDEFGEVQPDRRRRPEPEDEPGEFESDIAKRYAAYKAGQTLEDQVAAEARAAAPPPAAELSDEEADEQYAKFKREQRERLAESERRIAEREAAIARGETVNFISAPKVED
jgi:hypothetical protein